MSAFPGLCLFLLAADLSPDLNKLLKKVEDHYNRVRTLQLQFQESYSAAGRGRKTESGELSLQKPGKMRWAYSDPANKLFLSDGSLIYYYNPAANRVERTKLKEADDMRAPLAFLLGKLDFKRDFHHFTSKTQGQDVLVAAEPKSGRLPYRQVEFTLTPGAQIRKLDVTGHDQSILSFTFTEEQLNPPLDEGLFRFRMPEGASLLDLAGTEETKK